MNRFINALLVFIFLPTMLVDIFVGFDLPIRILKTSGANLPYRLEILSLMGMLMGILLVRRSVRRWMGIRIVSHPEKFKWNHTVSTERKKRVVVYTLLEVLVLTTAGLGLYIISPLAWVPAVALWFGAVDGLLFTLVGTVKPIWRVGLSSKALIVADREVVLLYFTGLRKVSIHQDTVYFDYIKGLQLTFPLDCIEADQNDEFFRNLEAQFDPDQVYVSQKH